MFSHHGCAENVIRTTTLRTDALLSLQTEPSDRVHRDELLFQTVHQTSELWLKLASAEVSDATTLLEQPAEGDIGNTRHRR